MRKIITLISLILIFGNLFSLAGCKSKDGENYNSVINEAEEYSFELVYTDTSATAPVYVNCYYKDGKYAYRFSLEGFDNGELAYRRIFTGGKLYEIRESKTDLSWAGQYKVNENVSANDERNFIYKYTNLITAGSYATMLTSGEDVVYRDTDCREYEFSYDGRRFTYVFEKETSLLLKFVTEEGDNVKTLEYYDYKFENIDTACLYPPTTFGINGGGINLYLETDKLVYEYFID